MIDSSKELKYVFNRKLNKLNILQFFRNYKEYKYGLF